MPVKEESYIGKLIATGIFDELIKTYGDENKTHTGSSKDEVLLETKRYG